MAVNIKKQGVLDNQQGNHGKGILDGVQWLISESDATTPSNKKDMICHGK